MLERTVRDCRLNRGNEGLRVWTCYIVGVGFAVENIMKLGRCYIWLVEINTITLINVPTTDYTGLRTAHHIPKGHGLGTRLYRGNPGSFE